MELIAGASGYVGSRLARRLAADERPVRALARRPERVEAIEGVDPIKGDLLTGAGLAQALSGCSTTYYLVHSMEASDDLDFAARDRRAAETFGAAAAAAGVERIVYLGGIAPGPLPPPALAARGRANPARRRSRSTALRASIVIGAGSTSFRLLVRLVERLRVLPMPSWRANRTQPIDERDVIEYLARTPAVPAAAGRSLDVCGPDVLSYGEMVERIAELMGVGRLPLEFGRRGPAGQRGRGRRDRTAASSCDL